MAWFLRLLLRLLCRNTHHKVSMSQPDQLRPAEIAQQRSQLSASEPLRKMLAGVVGFLMVCVVAVVGYVAAGWRLDDSIYMVIITIFGVGYGEVHPIESTALRALTIAVIIAGYGSLLYTAGGFMQMVVDGELNKVLGARRMSKDIERLTGHTIICGVGRMGSILARELAAAGKPFVIIDSNERRLQTAAELGYLIIDGDATEEHALQTAGIERAAVVATMLSDDATNVFVTITAREMNAEALIIARGEYPATERKLLRCGANRVVLPTAIGAAKVAHLIIRPTAENMLEQLASQGSISEELGQIGLRFDELEVTATSALANKLLSEIEIRSNHGFLIVGIRSSDGTTALNPPGTTQLLPGDVVIVLGHNDDIPQLAERFAAKATRLTYRGASIEQ